MKCSRGAPLLEIERIVDAGYNPVPNNLDKCIDKRVKVSVLKDLIKRKEKIKIWKCTNPECDYELA